MKSNRRTYSTLTSLLAVNITPLNLLGSIFTIFSSVCYAKLAYILSF